MKEYEVDGRKFVMRKVSLAVEDAFREIAFDSAKDEDGNEVTEFSLSELNRQLTNPAVLNSFYRVLLKGDHDGIDWYNDADAEVVRAVLRDFFTIWSNRIENRVAMLSRLSKELNSLTRFSEKEVDGSTNTELKNL